MVLRPYIAAVAIISATLPGIGAFVHSSGQNFRKQQSGYQHAPSLFQLASSVQPPILPHSSSSDGDAEEDERDPVWESPYSNVFRSQLQHQQQHGTTKNNPRAHDIQKKDLQIIIFNPGLQTEGVHTIKHSGSGSNVILAFESYKDCQSFARNLGSHMKSQPSPQKIHKQNLKAYASKLGMTVQVIPAGSNVKPPDRNHDLSMGVREQVPLLVKLKEQKAHLDQLIGSSPSSSGGVGEFGGLPVWG